MKPDLNKKSENLSTTESSKPTAKAVKSVPKPIGIVGFETEEFKEVKEWHPIYWFPFIGHARTFCRLKLLQTMISCTIVPTTYLLYGLGLVSIETCNYYTIVSIFAMVMMYVFGNLFRRLVGRAYISDDESLVRLSRLTFFGNRVDEDIEVKDIVPLKMSNLNLKDWYCRIERFSTNEVFFMSLKFGGILNKQGFEKVFGEDSSDIPFGRIFR